MIAVAAVSPRFASGMKNPDTGKTVSLKKNKIGMDDRWDVIVVGGGPGGCTAAISAAREGAKTLLIEATGQLGGMGTSGLVPAWCPFSDGEKIIYRGLAKKIFNESKKGVPHEKPEKLDWVHINPEHLVTVYDRMVTESGTRVLFFSRLAAVEMSAGDTVDALVVANKAGLTAFRAKVYVDATGDGDLAAWAGATF
jgi:flavin-dependent dehydrogenase